MTKRELAAYAGTRFYNLSTHPGTKCGTTTSLKLNFSYNPHVEAVKAWNKSVGGAE